MKRLVDIAFANLCLGWSRDCCTSIPCDLLGQAVDDSIFFAIMEPPTSVVVFNKRNHEFGYIREEESSVLVKDCSNFIGQVRHDTGREVIERFQNLVGPQRVFLLETGSSKPVKDRKYVTSMAMSSLRSTDEFHKKLVKCAPSARALTASGSILSIPRGNNNTTNNRNSEAADVAVGVSSDTDSDSD